jgi:hypothetical protein
VELATFEMTRANAVWIAIGFGRGLQRMGEGVGHMGIVLFREGGTKGTRQCLAA